MSGVSRFYIESQQYITQRIQRDVPLCTYEIQQAVFGSEYDADSQYQKTVIRDRIIEGREKALQQWNLYCDSQEFRNDFQALLYYGVPQILEDENEDYYDFYGKLLAGRFGEESESIREFLDDYIAISRLWTQKLKQYSQELNNLIISTYGRNAHWILPSWWRWAIRETNLYLRTVKILQRQFQRGISTKLLTASGRPIQEAVGYSRSIQGVLEDGNSWECPKCTMYNSGTSNFCSNCGTAKPEN